MPACSSHGSVAGISKNVRDDAIDSLISVTVQRELPLFVNTRLIVLLEPSGTAPKVTGSGAAERLHSPSPRRRPVSGTRMTGSFGSSLLISRLPLSVPRSVGL